MSVLCRHFGTCGGCAFQDMPKDAYRAMKEAQVTEALTGHGLEHIPLAPLADVPPATRRRATLKAARAGGTVKLGFHAARSHTIVDMQECRVLTPALVRVVGGLREILSVLLREGEKAELSLTETENGCDVGLTADRAFGVQGRALLAQWAGRHGVVRISVNGEVAAQFDTPFVRLADIPVELPPDTFLQPTRHGEKLLQSFVQQALTGARCVADLFAGVGTFTFALAGASRVHAVDSDTRALEALLAASRKAQRLKPVTVEARDLFKGPLAPAELKKFDAIVIDPPRAGALAQARALAASQVGRIAYVSCNPESFARDARVLLGSGFRIEKVEPIDQFLWSSHIELAAVFRRH